MLIVYAVCMVMQACLGASAKEGERNVVQITTENDEGEEVTHTILSMKLGLQEQVRLIVHHVCVLDLLILEVRQPRDLPNLN